MLGIIDRYRRCVRLADNMPMSSGRGSTTTGMLSSRLPRFVHATSADARWARNTDISYSTKFSLSSSSSLKSIRIAGSPARRVLSSSSCSRLRSPMPSVRRTCWSRRPIYCYYPLTSELIRVFLANWPQISLAHECPVGDQKASVQLYDAQVRSRPRMVAQAKSGQ